jgi:hypothetical protein
VSLRQGKELGDICTLWFEGLKLLVEELEMRLRKVNVVECLFAGIGAGVARLYV